MAFVIDDAAVVAAESAGEVAVESAEVGGEVAAESAEIAGGAAESSEILGDGVGENSPSVETTSDVGETSSPSESDSLEISGDGVGENSPSVETTSDVGETSSSLESDSSEILGDGEGENTQVDDSGKVYMKDGNLLPNNTYELNGNKYTTDEKGRIVRVEAKVEINNEPRSSLAGRKVEDMEPGDDKGHVVAHVLGGADEEGNLVAMDSKLNRGEYKSMELDAKRKAEEGKDVTMTVDIEYEGDSKRPKSFTVTVEVDGDVTVKKFFNKSE